MNQPPTNLPMFSSLPIVLVIIAIFAVPFYFFVQPMLQFYWFVFGLVLGLVFLQLDKQLLWKWYTSPDDPRPISLTHSLLFLGVFIPLLIFVVSSSGNMVGIGLVLSMAVQYSLSLIPVWSNPQLLLTIFPSQTPVSWQSREIRILTLIFWFVTSAMSLLVLIGNTF